MTPVFPVLRVLLRPAARLSSLKVTALAAAVVCLGGCNSIYEIFDDKPPPLEGERVSVLQYERDIRPDAAVDVSAISLPEPWKNRFWPQAGGYSNHAMGHLELPAEVKKVWVYEVEGGSRRQPFIAPPIVAYDLAYVLDTEGVLHAVTITDGKQKWEKALHNRKESGIPPIGGGVAFAQGQLFATTGGRKVYSLSPETGEVLWSIEAPGPVRAAPSALGGRVFILTLDNQLLAYDAADGALSWTYSGIPETTGLLGASVPAAERNLVVAAFSSGEIIAFRAENGRILWQDTLTTLQRTDSVSTIPDIRSLPVIDKGMIFSVSYSGKMVAVDERTGMRVWTRENGSAETPWAAGDVVFVLTSDQQLVALTRARGQVIWVSRLPRYQNPGKQKGATVWTGPVLAGGRLIVASNYGDVVEMDPSTGALIKKWETAGAVTAAPLVADGVLYLLTVDGKLVAYR